MRNRLRTLAPVALTVAGSDSSGGAGLQADLRSFALLGVRGASVVTCLTAQNRRAVARIEPVSPRMIRAQLEAVFGEEKPGAVKTGMLYSAAIVREVARFVSGHRAVTLVVDPVMIATSGRRLLEPAGVQALKRFLLPLAALVTPNRAEAEVLTGRRIVSPEDLRMAARQLHREFGCAALAKGGHLPQTRESIDVLANKDGEWLLSSPRARGVRLHGTGCVYSAAITAALARGDSLLEAIEAGKAFVTRHILEQAAPGQKGRR